jgi:NADH-quinone oxidoreductase subunit J
VRVKSPEIALFVLSALFTLGGGVATVGSRRPIRSAMGLLATILGICGCYLLLHAELLAAVQLIVYAGAVVVLFIFVVMLLGAAATSPPDAGSAVPRYLGAGVFLAFAVTAGALVMTIASERSGAPLGKPAAGFGTIEKLGHELFTAKIIPFELTGALLLVAVVGALAVGRGKHDDPTRLLAPPAGGPKEGAR